MPGLRDIAKNLRRTVTIAGEEIIVRGLTAREMADLLGTYPELGKLLGGQYDRVDAEALQTQAPDLFATMIVLGTANGKAPDEEDFEAARGLPGVAALDLISAIAELSLPRAVVRPFVAIVQGVETSDDTGKDLATK